MITLGKTVAAAAKSCRTSALAAFAAALSSASGCMWSRVKVNDPDIVERSHAVMEGETSEDELDGILLAKPTMRMQAGDVTTLAYSFSDTKHNGLMLVLVNFSRSTTLAETLYVDVDRKSGKVKKVHRPRVPEPEWRFWPFGDR